MRVLFAMSAILLNGCASLYSVSSFPPSVYGGVRLEARIVASAWSGGAVNCSLPYCSGTNAWWYYTGVAADWPFSLVCDTALFPYTLLANAAFAAQQANPEPK